MVATTPARLRAKLQAHNHLASGRLLAAAGLALVVGWLSHFGFNHPALVGVAVAVVVGAELVPARRNLRTAWLAAVPPVITGAAASVIIALSPRAAAQLGVGVIYFAWLWWRSSSRRRQASLSELLVLMAVVLEAIFLAAAIWHGPNWIYLIAVWATSYGLVYECLNARGERGARVLAATWSLVVVEVSWVFLTWLVTYVLFGSYVIVPQAALILTGLGYCFGGIYVSQRQQSLTRARLAEYLFIALLLVIIVASGTPWKGTL